MTRWTDDRRPTTDQRRAGWWMALLLLLSACASAAAPAGGLVEQRAAGLPWPVLLPPGFQISVYAKDLGEVRSIAFGPTGVPYVTIMRRARPGQGQVIALPDSNQDGVADPPVVVADKLDRPHGLLFHDGQLYVSDASSVLRLRDTDGDLVADARDTLVSGLPTKGDHWSRPFVFDQDGALLVIVGSSCNACQEGDKRRAALLRFTPGQFGNADARGEPYARGLRSVVGLTWRPGTNELWATNNGPDHLGPKLPPDQLFRLENGKHYGWPYCYGNRTPDPQVLADPDVHAPDGGAKDAFCTGQVTAPALLFPPHVAPLNMAFYDAQQFPAEMRGNLFVALHGAFDYSNQDGYKLVRIPFVDGKPGTPVDFLSGLAVAGEPKWRGRPVAPAVAPDGSLFLSDDANGAIYRISYTAAAKP